MKNLFELKDLLSELNGMYFTDFITTKVNSNVVSIVSLLYNPELLTYSKYSSISFLDLSSIMEHHAISPIDTAQIYGNEEDVGYAPLESGIKRV